MSNSIEWELILEQEVLYLTSRSEPTLRSIITYWFSYIRYMNCVSMICICLVFGAVCNIWAIFPTELFM